MFIRLAIICGFNISKIKCLSQSINFLNKIFGYTFLGYICCLLLTINVLRACTIYFGQSPFQNRHPFFMFHKLTCNTPHKSRFT